MSIISEFKSKPMWVLILSSLVGVAVLPLTLYVLIIYYFLDAIGRSSSLSFSDLESKLYSLEVIYTLIKWIYIFLVGIYLTLSLMFIFLNDMAVLLHFSWVSLIISGLYHVLYFLSFMSCEIVSSRCDELKASMV